MGKQESQSWQKTTKIDPIHPRSHLARLAGASATARSCALSRPRTGAPSLVTRSAPETRGALFSSHLANWRRWLLRMHPTLAPKNKPPTISQIRNEKQCLERENARLRLKLERAEKLLALRKKMADILDAIDRDERQSSRGKLA